MNPEDQRLVAALAILRKQLDPLIEEILAGQLDADERRAFALVLATVAGSLDPGIIQRPPALNPVTATGSGEREGPGAPPRGGGAGQSKG